MRRGNPFRQKLEQMQQRVGEDGRLYVYVDTSTLGLDLSVDASKAEVMERYIARLEHQLEEADERDRENRRIIAMLTSRIPTIEAPESPVPTPTLPRTAKTLKTTRQAGLADPEPDELHQEQELFAKAYGSEEFSGSSGVASRNGL